MVFVDVGVDGNCGGGGDVGDGDECDECVDDHGDVDYGNDEYELHDNNNAVFDDESSEDQLLCDHNYIYVLRQPDPQ